MRYIILLFLVAFSFVSPINATELSKALEEGEGLGWNHKDTYRPYPILFIHGIGGHCVDWNDPDNSMNYQGPDPYDGMIPKLVPYFEPYWKDNEKFSKWLNDITLSNGKVARVYAKTYLETVEFSDALT